MEDSFDSMSTYGTVELDAILRDYLLGLVLITATGSDASSRPVQWVHVSDLIDPTPFLTPRTVLLTTGAQFGDDIEPGDAEEYVTQLVTARAAALGVGVGVRWDRIPPALIEACELHSLPLFRVPYDTPFIAVVRTAARLIEAAAHSAGTWNHELPVFSSTLARRRNLAAAEESVRSAVLQLLLASQLELAESIANTILPRLPRGPVAMFCLPLEIDRKLESELTALGADEPGLFLVRQDEGLAIISERSLVAVLRSILETSETAAGISERGSLSEIPQLSEQAARAAEVALARGKNGPLDYRPQMHAGVLRLLETSPEAIRRAKGLLSPLLRHDQKHRDKLLQSVHAWLAHHGQISAAAAEIGVHRHTLRARIDTAGSLLQRNLDDPDIRAELWAALRLSLKS